jgi:hypothetical protein
MKMKKQLTIAAVLAVIAFVAVTGFTACSNGGGGGGGAQQPVVPLKETYVSYDGDGNEYKLVITEDTNGRALDPNKKYTYSLTITFAKDGTVAISTGTAKINTDNTNIILTHSSGQPVTVTVSGGEGSDTGVFTFDSDNKSSTIPVDSNSAVKIVPIVDLPYSLTKDGRGWIITSGKSFVKNGIADLPATFRNLPVTAIGPQAFFDNKNLTSVTIPASVTSIEGWGSFQRCTNLTTVNFAAGSRLQSLGNGAFDSCESLTAITIPAGVTSLGSIDEWSGVFQLCKKLETVTFAPNSQLKTIGIGAFAFAGVKNITIPAGVTSIGAMAFDTCTSITSIIIPASVTTFSVVRGDDGNVWGGQFADWTSSQIINVQGHASEEAAAAAWGWDWLAACDAVRKYWNGSSYQ